MYLQKEAGKQWIKSVGEVLKNINYGQSVGLYMQEVDEKIGALIQNSGVEDKENLEKEYKVFRRQLLAAIRKGKIQSFGDVSSFLVQFGTGNIPETIQEQEVLTAELDEDFWKQSNMKRPERGVIYRGGTARKILREYLGVDTNPADEHTDIDVFLSPEKDIDEVRSELQCDAEGITQLGDLSDATLHEKCKLVDLGMNQVLVSRDTLYFTDKSRKAMQTGVSELLEEREDLFGKKQYKDNLGRVVFTNQKIYRVLSMLVRGKLEKVIIRKDNVSSKNSDAIGGMQKYIIIVLKRILSEAGNDIQKLGCMMYRYADLLVQMGYIEKHEDMFEFIGNTHKEGPVKVHDSYLQKDFDDNGERDMVWRLDKMTRVLVRKIIPDTLDNFGYNHRNTIIELGVNYNGIKDFMEIFEGKWGELYQRIKAEDTEK